MVASETGYGFNFSASISSCKHNVAIFINGLNHFCFNYVTHFFSLLLKYNSPWDQGQISIKLGTEHVIYQKLANLM